MEMYTKTQKMSKVVSILYLYSTFHRLCKVLHEDKNKIKIQIYREVKISQ